MQHIWIVNYQQKIEGTDTPSTDAMVAVVSMKTAIAAPAIDPIPVLRELLWAYLIAKISEQVSYKIRLIQKYDWTGNPTCWICGNEYEPYTGDGDGACYYCYNGVPRE